MDETLADRLRQARLRAGYESAAEAARAFGWGESTYRSHENGTRGFRHKTAERYADAFRVSTTWLLMGEGGRIGGVPIVGKVGVGAAVIPRSDKKNREEAPAPPSAPDDVLALVVEGDVMWPAYAAGDVIYYAGRVEGAGAIHLKLMGRECVVQTADGRQLLKRLSPGSAFSKFTLLSYNAPPEPDVELEWAAPVLWIRKA